MTNSVRNLKGEGTSYQGNDTSSSTLVHDDEAIGLLVHILIELRKMNVHLEYLSGVNVEEYNIGDIE